MPGPQVPAFFRRAIRRINPKWVLVFRPPAVSGRKGVDARIYPQGVWDICTRLPRSQALHPQVTLSLCDVQEIGRASCRERVYVLV